MQFLGFAVCRNRNWYETKVLGEKDDQHCSPACMRGTVISMLMCNLETDLIFETGPVIAVSPLQRNVANDI